MSLGKPAEEGQPGSMQAGDPGPRRAPAMGGEAVIGTGASSAEHDAPGRAYRRRTLLRAAAAASAGGAGMWIAAAPGVSLAASAVPSAAHHPVTITMNGIFGTGQAGLNTLVALTQQAFEPFMRANRDIRVQITPQSGVPAIIAGTASDIIWDWNFYPYWSGKLLLPLDSYLQRDNVDTSIWVQGQMELFQRPWGTYMLGAYASPFVYAIMLDLLDELGLTYPSPEWTSDDFVRLAAALTTVPKNGKKRYGAAIPWYTTGIGTSSQSTFLLNAFGGALTNPGGTRSWLDHPGAVAAGDWVYHELLWRGIAVPWDVYSANSGQGLPLGNLAMDFEWGTAPFRLTQQLQGRKWAFQPFPVFPSGRYTFMTNDFWGIVRDTKYPEQAWRVLKWATTTPSFQVTRMHFSALQPTLKSLWPQWQAIVESVAPSLKGKGLHWFVDAAVGGYARCMEPYANNGSLVSNAVSQDLTPLWTHPGSSVRQAFQQAARQANVILSEGASGRVVPLYGAGTAAFAPQPPSLKARASAWKTTLIQAASRSDIIGGTPAQWSGPATASLAVALMWDAQALYLNAEITQGHPYTQTHHGTNIWKGDMLWCYFDTEPALQIGNTGKVGLAKTSSGMELWNTINNTFPTVPMEFQTLPHGWRIAATLPWSMVGQFKPAKGAQLQFNAGIGWAPDGSTNLTGFFDLNGQNPDGVGTGVVVTLG